MLFTISVAVYLLAHFVICVLFPLYRFKSVERSIFLLHVASFVAVALVTLLAGFLGLLAPANIVIAICLHAIYSLSYLELWALGEGSLSLRILSQIAKSGPQLGRTITEAHLGMINEKKAQRVDSLVALHIVQRKEGSWRLLWLGRGLAAFLYAIRFCAGLKEGG